MGHEYRNKPLSLDRVKEIQHQQVKTFEQFNGRRLNDAQRSRLNENVVKEAKRIDREKRR